MQCFPDGRSVFEAAQRYCGNYGDLWNAAGGAQYEILRAAGLQQQHRLLEIGCGCLSCGFVVMQYLELGGYCGIDPNKWLIDAAMAFTPVRKIAAQKAPRFVYSSDFDASDFCERFDFVFAHSVLSHCSREGMRMFLDGVTATAAPRCTVVASYRDGEMATETGWVYPDHSYLSFDDVSAEASARGWRCIRRPIYREALMSVAPTNHHDWLELSRG